MNKFRIFFAGFKLGLKNFSHLLTGIINFVLLFFVYFIGIGSVSIISKLFRKHFLDLKNSGSSWILRKLKKRPLEEYYRAF